MPTPPHEPVEAYPLQWPAGWKRTANPQWSRFEKRSLHKATQEVLTEVDRLGGSYPVVSSNVPLRKDGLPRSDWREPADSGVAVYFLLGKAQRVIACDTWYTVAENLHAIALSIQAMRGLQRWGAGAILERAFQGFTALPHIAAEAPWYETLGVPPAASVDAIRAARLGLARKYHPNNGSQPDEAMMARVNAAAEQGLKERGA